MNKNLPLFPVSITEDDFQGGETQHGGGVIIPDPVVDKNTPSYIFTIFEKQYQGLVIEDYQMDYVPFRLYQNEKKDMRQMRIYLMGDDCPIQRTVFVSYYVLRDNTKSVIFVLARAKN